MIDAQVKEGLARDADARPHGRELLEEGQGDDAQPEQTITIRLDADLLKWLRSQPSYQRRINAVLRTYMQAHT